MENNVQDLINLTNEELYEIIGKNHMFHKSAPTEEDIEIKKTCVEIYKNNKDLSNDAITGKAIMEVKNKTIREKICNNIAVINLHSNNNITEIIIGISTILSAIFTPTAAIAGAVIIVRTGFNIYCKKTTK